MKPATPPTLRSTLGALAAAAIISAAGSGCASDPGPAALAAYEAGQYRQALAAAEPGAPRSEPLALIAGLAAQAAGDETRAVRWLAPLRDSADPQVQARALAGLGLVALQEDRPADAAELLRQAARALDAPHAARALLLAGDAARRAGHEAQARSDYRIARVRAAGAQPITTQLTTRLTAQ